MWLKDQGRTLTEEQWAKVHEALSKCNLPLYAQLVFGEVRTSEGKHRVGSHPAQLILGEGAPSNFPSMINWQLFLQINVWCRNEYLIWL